MLLDYVGNLMFDDENKALALKAWWFGGLGLKAYTVFYIDSVRSRSSQFCQDAARPALRPSSSSPVLFNVIESPWETTHGRRIAPRPLMRRGVASFALHCVSSEHYTVAKPPTSLLNQRELCRHLLLPMLLRSMNL